MRDIQERFIADYQKLVGWSDNSPESLIADCEIDDSLKELCLSVFNSAISAATTLEKVGELSTADTKFVQTLRDYERRYEHHVSNVYFTSSIAQLKQMSGAANYDINGDIFDGADVLRLLTENILNHYNEFNTNRGEAIQKLAKNAVKNIKQELEDCNELMRRHGELRDDIVGFKAEKLTEIPALFQRLLMAGIDLEGIYRRTALMPNVIIPIHISKTVHNQEKVALYQYISQARQAFVAGSYAGAVALLRALIEHILTDYYGAGGGDLASQIGDAQGLPVNKSTLHEIRIFANGMLHYSHPKNEDSVFLKDFDAEVKISKMFETVSELIEGIPILRVV